MDKKLQRVETFLKGTFQLSFQLAVLDIKNSKLLDLVVLNSNGTLNKKISIGIPISFALSLGKSKILVIEKMNDGPERPEQNVQIVDINSGTQIGLKLKGLNSQVVDGVLLEASEEKTLVAFVEDERTFITSAAKKPRISIWNLKSLTKIAEIVIYVSYGTHLRYSNGIAYYLQGNHVTGRPIRENGNFRDLKRFWSISVSISLAITKIITLGGSKLLLSAVSKDYLEDSMQLIIVENGNIMNSITFDTLFENIVDIAPYKDDNFISLSGVGGANSSLEMRSSSSLKIIKSYQLSAVYHFVMSLGNDEYLLGYRTGLSKFNIKTRDYKKEFAGVGYQSENTIISIPNNDLKIPRCFLLVKLKKRLPRDLILETFSFF